MIFWIDWHRSGKYLDSYKVIRQARQIMKKNGWRSAVIVAHPDHYARCASIAKWFGVLRS